MDVEDKKALIAGGLLVFIVFGACLIAWVVKRMIELKGEAVLLPGKGYQDPYG